MKKSLFFIIPLAAAALVSCQREQKVAETSAGSRIEPVKVVALEMQEVARTVEYTATLQAFEEIHLSPSSPGRIESIGVEVGDRVRQGQVLVQMDRTAWHQASIQMRTLETDLRRLDTLRKTTDGFEIAEAD
ncbi:MAG TPA: biotin/lipoyl-binding protein, partial [Bacteroidales bacterium]|nr:biotin/lipoyl-binding protein [Bacteroidales bacterium]